MRQARKDISSRPVSHGIETHLN
uniref:Uncharacterized protein n=1 Tax=Rhizophora mucronata TaxID=61149 RepID=A0A2P2QZC2_RHIMU